ncbi:MAG: sigma-54-dependent Fis family transcriptional regulator [Planctomycetes bacterium]|nr:sigma-54-dependent Fis family transcriptional regulator [Planctomycetota bacterium]
MPNLTALMISRDAALIETVRQFNNIDLQASPTIAGAQAHLQTQEVALVLIHVVRPDEEAPAQEFVCALSRMRPGCVTLVLSNEYRNQQAVSMLRAGATDYFSLPDDGKKLAYLFEVLAVRAEERGSVDASARGHTLPFPARREPLSFILSPEIVEVMDQVRKVVAKDATLLLTGETGTGKTRLARHIHELSPRRNQPFLIVDCGALSANLVESEMFGHIKGAFTDASRDRTGKFFAVGAGTLLLDEINALPLGLQSKLLRAVEDRVFEPVGSNRLFPLKARIIAASNTALDEEVRRGNFRADLFYRLNVVGFSLPPLRERTGAIAPLANKFFAEFAGRNGHDLQGIESEALQLLAGYHWPGNIRELRNVIERAVALSPGPEIRVEDLPDVIRCDKPVHVPPLPDDMAAAKGSLCQVREEAEIVRVTEALLKHGNNRVRAAAELGISRMALYKKLHKYGLINTA